nr:S41 family peptidase [Roseomonas acroporae]
MFNHLDPYSRYISPEEASLARQRRIGIEGLGLRLAAGRDGGVVLAEVLPHGPAARAALRAGDRLLAVDGTPIEGRSLADAIAALEGPHGSESVLRLGRGTRRWSVRLSRTLTPPETVVSSRQGDILTLRVTSFSNATDRSLARALADNFARHPPRGVILDLRGNRGGLLAQAVAVADAFLPGGEVAHTDGRHPEAIRLYVAGESDLARGRPVVVLVDGRTASAAEIVAASLGDRGRAAIVGSATTGKGLIQVVIPLPNGGELLVTWSRVLAPDGWPIQGLGVLPELCTSLGAEALAESMRLLRAGEAPMRVPLARLRAARAPVPASEVTALRGACPAAEGRDADLAAARQLIDSPAAYDAARGR